MTASAFTFVFPGDPATATGGFIYDRRIRDCLITNGADIGTLVLEGPFPSSDKGVTERCIAVMSVTEPDTPLVIDGLALGGFGDQIAVLSGNYPLIGLVHHPLSLETGLTAAEARQFSETERKALAHCCGVIATSETTHDTLVATFGVSANDCVVVPPGLEPLTLDERDVEVQGAPRLLSVGTLIPRKGHLDLIKALAQLKQFDWQLDVVGDDTLNPQHARRVREMVADAGLEARITVHGKRPQDELRRFYYDADVFVLAAHYEGYGMAFAEAVAAGLPIIGTTGGAIPQTVPDGCGILVEPGDVDGLRRALETVISSPDLRASMTAASRAAAAQFKDWPDRAVAFADAVTKFAARWREARK
ncbi:MAG: glycosyltransferase family 4 protein [Pseudomonadota bacterium]